MGLTGSETSNCTANCYLQKNKTHWPKVPRNRKELPSKLEQSLQQSFKDDGFFPLCIVITGFNGFCLVSEEHELTRMQAVTA